MTHISGVPMLPQQLLPSETGSVGTTGCLIRACQACARCIEQSTVEYVQPVWPAARCKSCPAASPYPAFTASRVSAQSQAG